MQLDETATLSADEVRRYARQIVLRGVGGPGQQKLKSSRMLVVGAGALGSPVIAYLAGAGVGTLGIADNDIVALSNLHRQVVHGAADIGRAKVDSAGDFVAALNPHVTVVRHGGRITAENAAALVAGYDLVLDGTDTMETRRVIARAASAAGRMLVAGAVSMFDGHVTVFPPSGEGFPAGFLSVYPDSIGPEDLPSCEVVGVLGATAGVIGTLMAMEAIKLATGLGEPLVGRLLLYDGQGARFTEVGI